jgi:hypothetical protein
MYKFTAMPFSSLVYIFLGSINIVLHIFGHHIIRIQLEWPARHSRPARIAFQQQRSRQCCCRRIGQVAVGWMCGFVISSIVGGLFIQQQQRWPRRCRNAPFGCGDGRSTPDDIRTSRRESHNFFLLDVREKETAAASDWLRRFCGGR